MLGPFTGSPAVWTDTCSAWRQLPLRMARDRRDGRGRPVTGPSPSSALCGSSACTEKMCSQATTPRQRGRWAGGNAERRPRRRRVDPARIGLEACPPLAGPDAAPAPARKPHHLACEAYRRRYQHHPPRPRRLPVSPPCRLHLRRLSTGRPTSLATTWSRCCTRRRAGCARPASCWPSSGVSWCALTFHTC
jgi:hypothetical protein